MKDHNEFKPRRLFFPVDGSGDLDGMTCLKVS